MRALLLFIVFLGVSQAVTCWIGSTNGVSPPENRSSIECSGDCKYCAKGVLVLANSVGYATWGCGCGGGVNDIATEFGATCTKKGKTERSTGADGKETMYCCKGDKCNSANQKISFYTIITIAFIAFLSLAPNKAQIS
ncbi:unnamed protein product, partial [Mesorhabditis belari]|uniref:Uncharacterized protein n=1 Tax=Mesorhabditis belari TaxID=2138241 RepID=A0AAF3JBZ4_9BILA